MSKLVIKVENLSKQYRLGEIGTGSIAHDLNRWWYLVRGKEDPYLKVGENNDRTTKGGSDYVWALRNIDFEVKQGEVLGVIGRNGAGKSTLLKILSKTTTPTVGNVKIKGRIASLLEVGTGFHPELSGRENIFLNGAIMGMSKKEIKSKFDEIVDFAGVTRYVDTPVKRYSSGMYVRLAFAVAAHLEPEILIVDEVLAVGDAEFQKKCLGKMKDVSENDGRAVLFVSHNMGVISNLCHRAILLHNGKVADSGEVNEVVNYYIRTQSNNSQIYSAGNKENKSAIYFSEIKPVNSQGEISSTFLFNECIRLQVKMYANEIKLARVTKIGIALLDRNENRVFSDLADCSQFIIGGSNEINFSITLPSSLFAPGRYSFLLAVQIPNQQIFDLVDNVCSISILDNGTEMASYEGFFYGNVIVKPQWRLFHETLQ